MKVLIHFTWPDAYETEDTVCFEGEEKDIRPQFDHFLVSRNLNVEQVNPWSEVLND